LATSWVGLLTAYAGAVTAAILAFKKLEEPLHDWPAWGRLALVSALPLAAFVFHTIPTLIEQRRKKKLTEITGNLRPGYFRLAPRDDQESFTRADGMHEEVLAWLRRPEAQILYLTGQSGSGKSSLLAAWVIPHLIKEGARVVRLRGYQDPLAALQEELLKPGVIWQRPSPDAGGLRPLLERACRNISGRLLVVLDQFEEFVIFEDAERRKQFEEFLGSLRHSPIANLVFLFVFRSDYIGLVEKLSLPPLAQSSNWKEVPPFTEMAALEFMKGSGLQVEDSLLRDVLREAAELEQTKGLIRPVTINLCGLVLGRFAGALPRGFRQGGLIRAFLRESVFLPSIRDFAPRVIPHLISGYVTKRPRTVDELAKDTKLDMAAVRGCLRVLGQNDRAIVRALDAEQQTWEISHDFLVPLLDSIVARWTVSLWRKTRPWLPWAAGAALVVLAIGTANWRKDPLIELTDMGWAVQKSDRGLGLAFAGGVPPKASLPALRRIHSNLGVGLVAIDSSISEWRTLPNLSVLQLSNSSVNNLEPLSGLKSLSGLDINNTAVSDLEPIKGLTNLAGLDISSTPVSDLDPLRNLVKLSDLDVSSTQVSNLESIKGLSALSTLNLSHTMVHDLEPLKGLPNLSTLTFIDTPVTTLDPLRGLTKLSEMDLRTTKVRSLQPLKDLHNLSKVVLINTPVDDLEPLRGLTKLSEIDIRQTSVHSLDPLKDLTNLSTLNVSWLRVSDLDPLKRLTNLATLDLGGTDVNNLEPLRGLTRLSKLNASAKQVRNLEPLVGLVNLTSLDLSDTQVSDLKPLAGLVNLAFLNLSSTQVSNVEPLRSLTHLEELKLSYTQVSDLQPLRRLANLSNLELSGTPVSDLEPLVSLSKLSTLDLSGTQITDFRPLRLVTSLSKLYLYQTQVSEDSLAEIQKVNPKLKIIRF
jgi:Leucine-rich repeat (LRR) protein